MRKSNIAIKKTKSSENRPSAVNPFLLSKIPKRKMIAATKGIERKSEKSDAERVKAIHVKIISAALKIIRNTIKSLDTKCALPQERNCRNLPFS